MGASVLVIYLSAIYGTYVPDWHFTVQSNNGTVQLTVSPRFLFSLFFSKKKNYELLCRYNLNYLWCIVGDAMIDLIVFCSATG